MGIIRDGVGTWVQVPIIISLLFGAFAYTGTGWLDSGGSDFHGGVRDAICLFR
jgi:hypothetical protein